MYNALTIAMYIINRCFEEGAPVTNLRLQKLLYFIQGMSYVITGRALIREDFYAWQYGPVVPKVYFEYNGYIGNPIRINYNVDVINDDDTEIIDYVIDRLSQYRDSVLVDLSHEKDGPWYKHRLDRSIIKKEEIEKYFMELQNGNR